jgi:ATP-dependent helicase HrpB
LAPPGSGKTTRVPLALLDAPWLAGRRVVVLEPRRVAARAAARRMAETLGEPLGQRIGYRVRHERVRSAATRIEVVTEGVLIRMLQADPSLEDVGAVLFDEFHERSIAADLALALTLDARAALRPDLRILVMSATLEATAVAGLIGDAPVVMASTVAYPVSTIWVGRPSSRVDAAVARTVVRAIADADGDILAFLPGVAEIRTVERSLREAGVVADSRHQGAAADSPGAVPTPAAVGAGVEVVTLYGAMAGPAQDEALRPAPAGRRKVILSTSIAETSLTIDGVRVVVDSGLMRVPRFDPSAGMTRLVTLPVSQAAAAQRQGRCARQGPGVCYRLWSAAEHAGLARAAPPEILVADLAPLALDLAEWGVTDPGELRWLDPPPAGPLDAARQVLSDLGAIDDDGRITTHGRAIAGLGVHPRLGHLLVRAAEAEVAAPGTVVLACEIAAVLSEGDPERGGTGRDADLTARVEGVRQGRYPRLGDVVRQWLRRLPVSPDQLDDVGRGRAGAGGRGSNAGGFITGATVAVVPQDVGRLAALAYPDRVGRLRTDRPGHWLLRNGRGAWVPETDPMATSTWVVAAELDGDRRDARIWMGAPLHPADVEELFGGAMVTVDRTGWDPRLADVVATRERRLGAIVVSASPQPAGGSDGLIDGVRALGLGLLPWTPELDRLRARVAFARRVEGDRWADLSDEALVNDLETWLTPWLQGRTRRRDLAGLALGDALWHRIGGARRAELDAIAPTHHTMPTGERRRLEYPPEGPPSLAVRLQELFGTTTTPTVANGRVPVQLQLTSPAGRPVQVTSDLASFWATTYPQVRGELRARYPRHAWPDDPLRATPTSRARPRRR